MHLTDSSVGIIGESAIVGGGIPIAIGAALTAQVKKTDQVSLTFFGDGASNQGTFHESINMAAIWNLPAIFFCENNLYAATTPLAKTHGQPDIAKRAVGYGIPGVIVDGQDCEAVYELTRTAVERARRGDGPTLIEAKTYRFDEHAIGLYLPVAYRSQEEIDSYKTTRDPVVLFRDFLQSTGFNETELVAIESDADKAVEQAVAFALESPFPDPADVYDYMYSNPINYPA
jgi:pyruvate dehydrogenase E1 component alpha subunit